MNCAGRKRICIMMPGHWSRIMGGSQYQAKCLIDELAKTDRFEIFYLARDCEASHKSNGYTLVRYTYPGADIRGAHRQLIEMALLPRILKQIDPQIIYQRVGCSQTGVAARYALKNRRAMVWHIASEYDLESSRLSFSRLFIERFLDKYLLNYGIRHATRIIAQTEDQKRLLCKNFQRSPSAVIPNFHPAPTEIIAKENPIKVVWVSNLKDLKQPEIFINLARELQGLPNTQFIMVGALQGAERVKQRYRHLMAQAGNLKYLGPKSQEEVNLILAQSHIFVNTSRKEGFPNTFIQAWMRQVPVVSLGVDPDRLIERHFLGLVSGSYEKLKQDTALLIGNRSLREQYGLNAQEFALQYFSTKNAENIVHVLDGSVLRDDQ